MKNLPPLVSIREVRLALGLTSVQLAQRIKEEEDITVDPDSLLNIELGRKQVSATLLRAWARVLRMEPLNVHRPDDLRDRLVQLADEVEAEPDQVAS
jgi:transcriptional regulator with XRE-family HTH domain